MCVCLCVCVYTIFFIFLEENIPLNMEYDVKKDDLQNYVIASVWIIFLNVAQSLTMHHWTQLDQCPHTI